MDRLGEEVDRLAREGLPVDYASLGQQFGVGAHAVRRIHLAQQALAPRAPAAQIGGYLVTDLVEGESLGERLRGAGALSARESAQIARQLADAVVHAHAASILHRDLKPDNVLLDEAGARLADFGLAKDLEDERMTRTRAMLGTPGYWSPEQARGEPATAQSDVYGLGAILHACRTGAAPGRGAAPRDPRLDAIEARCLAPDPADRYPDAASLADDLDDYLRAPPTPKPPAHRSFVVGGVVGILATTVGVVITAAALQSAPKPKADGPAAKPIFEGSNPSQERDQVLLTALNAAKAGSWGEAERALSRALEYDDAHAPSWTQRGRARRELGQFEAAASDLHRAIELAPDDPRPWYQLGLTAMVQNKIQAAHQAFDQAVKRKPPPGELRSRAYNNRGLCRLRLERWAEAAKDFDEATQSNPRNARAHLNAGLAYQKLKNHTAAIEAFTRALQIDANYFKAAYGRAQSNVELERYRAAIGDYSSCLKIDPTALAIHRQRARAYLLARDPHAALKDIRRAIEHRPRDPVSHLHLTVILKALGRYREALDAGAAGLELDPNPRLKRAIEGVMARIRPRLDARPQR